MEIIRELVRYYAHRHHAPIEFVTEAWQIEAWNRSGILVAMPEATDDDKNISELSFGHDPAFVKQLGGDLIVVQDLPMARVGKQWIVLFFLPTNKAAWDLARKIVEEHLPRLCRQYRHHMRSALVESIAACVHDRKRELSSSIREDSYELERLGLQMMQLSRKLETDRQVVRMFERAPEWIKARTTRTFVDLMKLVPGTYAHFSIEDDSVTGSTHEIDIEYEGYTYHFDPYEVEVNLRQGKVLISGGTDANGYIHPHISDPTNICWGNVGHLVSRLVGELDLFGLFQLVHQFLTTYNASDPYQRIEKWDPDWEEQEEEDEPWCDFCQDYGHTIEECEYGHCCAACSQYVPDDHICPHEEQEEEDAVAQEVA